MHQPCYCKSNITSVYAHLDTQYITCSNGSSLHSCEISWSPENCLDRLDQGTYSRLWNTNLHEKKYPLVI